ncbi:jg6607 [Pararge aegeria aegeria]|uniref:Jg6607 protein n=1 Tax=Pararge aegeria aegeria TaxID=348720 RepID=A0A8S4RWS8_9NEOP|nr:jg6607 [Pararge aegeria aegeria]
MLLLTETNDKRHTKEGCVYRSPTERIPVRVSKVDPGKEKSTWETEEEVVRRYRRVDRTYLFSIEEGCTSSFDFPPADIRTSI